MNSYFQITGRSEDLLFSSLIHFRFVIFAISIFYLSELLNDYKIGGFIVGLPLSLDNSENEQTKKIRVFSNELKTFFKFPIEFWDERYSSDVIFKEMRKSNLSSTKIKKKLDQQSAAYILQGYLDRYRKSF